MGDTAMPSYSFFRHCIGKVVLLVFVLSTVSFHNARCGSISNRGNHNETQNDSEGFSHRQSAFGFSHPNLHADNVFLNTPASFGFPVYHNQRPFPSIVPFQQTATPGHYPGASLLQGSSMYEKVKPAKIKQTQNVTSDDDNQSIPKVQKQKRRKRPETKESDSNAYAVESKTDDGTERGCPGCVGGPCDPNLDPHTNISGIPVIQILIGMGAGIFWATIFLFLLKNFLLHKHKKEEGGGYAPQYGTPQQDYGAPAPSSSYNVNRMSLSNDYGRYTKGYTFNQLSNWVWEAIDKLADAYDN